MRTLVISTTAAAIALAALAGCTSRQVYGGLQSMQRNQCLEQQDTGLRERCLAAADPTYDEYARQR